MSKKELSMDELDTVSGGYGSQDGQYWVDFYCRCCNRKFGHWYNPGTDPEFQECLYCNAKDAINLRRHPDWS